MQGALMDPDGVLSMDELYGDLAMTEEEIDALLDQSLDPRGPDVLFDLAGSLGVGPGSAVIDVGCGDGAKLLELVRRFGVTGFGVDPVRANLDRGARLLAEADRALAARVTLAQGVIEALPFPDSAFDLVWSRDMLIHVPDLDRGLAECRRVVKGHGGRMLVFNMFATPWLEPDEADRLWPMLGAVPGNTDVASVERAFAGAGFIVEQVLELRSEWREHREEHGDRRTSRQLLHAARLLRDPDRYVRAIGRSVYRWELGNCLWGVYQMIGKLGPRVYVLAPA